MSRESREEPCPYCGELIRATATRCRFCGEDLTDEGEEDDRPRRRPRRNTVEATDFLVPTNVSGWALASCYLGLLGFCLPLVGVVFALPAFIFGIIALRRNRHRAETYGEVTSNARAVIGLILGGLGTVGWPVLFLIMLASGAFK
jgi:hypothetical protein